jgi:hypothetical protein
MMKKMRKSTPEEIKARVENLHSISEEEYKKIAKESMSCPLCCGRPLLHMRLCMKKMKKVI